jgi:hypothetical protein
MKVLVACEESQTVCKAFREKGHEAYSCDVQECSGGHPEWHICGDALQVLGGNCFFITQDMIQHEIVGHWDIVIAHPPCTYISNAGACRLFPKKGELDYKRYSDGLNGKNFFMCFYLYGLYGVGKIAIENPVPSSVFELPPATQVIQPWQFGDPYSKKTLLWLFGLPELKPTKICRSYKPYCPSGTSRKLGGESYGAAKRGEDAKNRAKFFPGIANAFADQWGCL